jgi:hypothetical protein
MPIYKHYLVEGVQPHSHILQTCMNVRLSSHTTAGAALAINLADSFYGAAERGWQPSPKINLEVAVPG